MLFLSLANCNAELYYEASVNTITGYVGDPLRVSVTATNTSGDPVELMFPTQLQMSYGIDDEPCPQFGSPLTSNVTIPGNESFTWGALHNLGTAPIPAGEHALTACIAGYWESAPILFDLQDAPPVTEDVFLDFETYGDGTPTVYYWHLAYASQGVLFGTNLDSGPTWAGTFDEHEENKFLAIQSTTYPPGFNLFADLQMPVNEVSVRVSSAVGVTVTMVAFDEDGNELAAVTSQPTETVFEFGEPISLATDTPIAQLQWWPSNQMAAVNIDDLFLGVVPEPGSATLALVCLVSVIGYLRRSATS